MALATTHKSYVDYSSSTRVWVHYTLLFDRECSQRGSRIRFEKDVLFAILVQLEILLGLLWFFFFVLQILYSRSAHNSFFSLLYPYSTLLLKSNTFCGVNIRVGVQFKDEEMLWRCLLFWACSILENCDSHGISGALSLTLFSQP